MDSNGIIWPCSGKFHEGVSPTKKLQQLELQSGTPVRASGGDKGPAGIYVSLVLPSLILGTVGGGTALATQKECLSLMGCQGKVHTLIVNLCLTLAFSLVFSVLDCFPPNCLLVSWGEVELVVSLLHTRTYRAWFMKFSHAVTECRCNFVNVRCISKPSSSWVSNDVLSFLVEWTLSLWYRLANDTKGATSHQTLFLMGGWGLDERVGSGHETECRRHS